MSTVRRGWVDVRQKGGNLPSSWTKVYCVMTKTEIKYYASRDEAKKHGTALQRTPLSTITTVSQSARGDGFMWEIRATQCRTQHLSSTEEDRTKWIECIKMVKSDTQPQENVQGPSESDPKSEKQAKYAQMTKEELKRQKDEITEKYKREVEEKISDWKETKEELLLAIYIKEKQKIEDEYQTKQLELEKELQFKRSKLQAFLAEEK